MDLEERLKQALSGVLQTTAVMCSQSILKSKDLLQDVEGLRPSNVQKINNEVKKLLDRMGYNITEFGHRFNQAVEDYIVALAERAPQLKVEENGLKSRSRLSLNRTTDSETDSTSGEKTPPLKTASESYEETIDRVARGVPEPPSALPEAPLENGVDKDTDSDDSENTIEYGCLEPSRDHAITREDIANNLLAAESRDNQEREKETETSFDFDSQPMSPEPQPETAMSDFDFSQDDRPKVDPEEVRRENDELLQLLSDRIVPSQVAPKEKSEASPDELEEALRRLEESPEGSIISNLGYESDGSSFSDDELSNSDEEIRFRGGSAGSRQNVIYDSDDELSEDETSAIVCKDLKIAVSRIDDMSDSSVDRLCDLHNIDKRKCSPLRTKRKLKKRRLLNGAPSVTSSSGTTTPDDLLELKEVRDCDSPPLSPGGGGIERYAEMIAEELMKSDAEDVSTDSDVQMEEEGGREKEGEKEKQKEGEKEKDKEGDDDVQFVSETRGKDQSEGEKARRLHDPILTLRLSSDSEDDPAIKKEGGEGKERTRTPGERRKGATCDNEIISDSDSSTSIADNSSDCEILDELNDSTGAGRKKIRPIMSEEELSEATQRAKIEEETRILRLEEHSKNLELIQSQHDEFVLDGDENSGEPLVTVNQRFADKLKPHQRAGVQFMWDACYESVARLKNDPGTGCILAHCMGLGKTFQVITLIHTLFAYKCTKTRHVLVICPLSTVANWRNEFKLAFDLLEEPPKINLHFLIKQDLVERCKVIQKWREENGVLVMGYECYSTLTNPNIENKVKSNKLILDRALVDPGPDLIICDEGHLLKNEKSLRSRALVNIKTRRRIVLTGTPLQNNLKEYYCMVQFVKPHLLGNKEEYSNRFTIPIMNGQYFDSTAHDVNLMKKRTHVLNKLLKKTIHRVDSKVLKSYLPDIVDYTIFVKMHTMQVELYKKYVEMVNELNERALFADFYQTKMIGLHPYTLSITQKVNAKKKKPKEKETVPVDTDFNAEAKPRTRNIKDDWYLKHCPEDLATNPLYGTKLVVIFKIIDKCVRAGDKLLIFSCSLIELDCIEHFLKTTGTDSCTRWAPELDYLRLDGVVAPATRHDLCNKFNDERNTRIKLFLVSHRVGGLGLNLIAANRVILVGCNFNPCYDTQSIYRSYRFGQKKKVFVYRLLSMGSMEETIYQRCVLKLAVAGTVIDKFHIARHYKSQNVEEFYQLNFGSYDVERPVPSVPSDKCLATLLQCCQDLYRYFEHGALLENRPEEELNEEEKKLAWEEYNNEEAKALAAACVVPQAPPLLPPAVLSWNLRNGYPVFSGMENYSRTPAANIPPDPLYIGPGTSTSTQFDPRSVATPIVAGPVVLSRESRRPQQGRPLIGPPATPSGIIRVNRTNIRFAPRSSTPLPRPPPPPSITAAPRLQASARRRSVPSIRINQIHEVIENQQRENERETERNTGLLLNSIKDRLRSLQQTADASSPEFNYHLNKIV